MVTTDQLSKAHWSETMRTNITIDDRMLPNQRLVVDSPHLNQQCAMKGRRVGRQEICPPVEAATGWWSSGMKTNSIFQRQMMNISNTDFSQVPKTRQPTMRTPHLEECVIRHTRCGGQEICQKILPSGRSFSGQRNTTLTRDMTIARETIPNRALLTRQSLPISSHLTQQSTMYGRQHSQQDVCQQVKQQTRRNGVCNDTDGVQDQRTFLRVLSKCL